MTELDASPRERVERFVESRRGSGLDVVDVEPLAGDASNRIYFRLRLGGRRSLVLALVPAPFDPEGYPFIEAEALFRELGLRVPRVMEAAGEEGALLLEDLGDRLLQTVVAEHEGREPRRLYEAAVDGLSRLQEGAARTPPDRFLPLRVAFDAQKFYDELEFFREHFVEGLRAVKPDPSERDVLGEAFRTLADELSAQPYALCHRDYHSRNLLCLGDEIAVIDFQDARMGPRCYDLASLLNDSYVALSPALVSAMKDRFAEASSADVAAEYDLAALQRNLKALGTFGFQIARRGNAIYRPYVAPTLELVRANLERQGRWDRLWRVLAGLLPELA